MYLFITGIVLCFLFTLFLYLNYADPKTKIYVSILVFFIWFLNFINVVILPFDIFITFNKSNNKSDYERYNSGIKLLWTILYWIIFFNSWLIIPIVQDYEKAGDFTSKDKLKRAIKTNICFYIISALIGIIFIMYLMIKKNLNGENLVSFLIALSNAWGIFVVILMLGYGLVALPKKLWKNADYNLQIQYLQWKASETRELLDEHINELSKYKSKIKAYRAKMDNNIETQMILDKIWIDLNNIPNYQDDILEEGNKKEKTKFSMDEVIELNQSIKIYQYETDRCKTELKEILKDWIFLKDLLKEIDYSDKINFSNKIKNLYYLRIRPYLFRFLSVFCTGISFIIVFSEITLFLEIKLSLLGLLTNLTSNNIISVNLLCIIPLIYLFVCALFGLFSLKLSGYYGMYKNRKTDAISLLFLANFMCRIGFALCVNYLQILKLDIKTGLDEVIGGVNLVPIFGSSFTLFYPAVLVFLCLFNIFDLYGKLLNYLGFTTFGFKDNFNYEKIQDGINILEEMKKNKTTDSVDEQENRYNYYNKKADLSNTLIKTVNKDEFIKVSNSSSVHI